MRHRHCSPRLALIGASALLALAGCDRSPALPAVNPDAGPAPYVGKFSYLALGDSYTICEGMSVRDRWPNQMAEDLRDAGLDLSDPYIVARTGWTTDELLTVMKLNPIKPHYDLVTLMIGVNNEYRGRPIDAFVADVNTLLADAIGRTGDAGRVVVVSIPDWSVTPFGQHSDRPGVPGEIDQFNAAYHDAVTKAGARWVDVTAASRTDGGQDDLYARDGLHPSVKQYRQWLDQILPQVMAAMQSPAATRPGR